MTANFFTFPRELLGRVATHSSNEGESITSVVDDVTSEPPGTVEWE